MKRLMVVAVVGVMSLGGAAHGESVAMKKAVDSCVAETLAFQHDGLSAKDRQLLESRVKLECKNIVLRECSSAESPLCQHFSGMPLAAMEQDYPAIALRTAFSR